MHRKAFFFDRDGVINQAPPRGIYITSLDQIVLMEDISEVMQAVRQAGFLVIIVTNQPQIAKGTLTTEGLFQIHRYLQNSLSGLIDAIYYCPHQDSDHCRCRKPAPGLLKQATKDLGIDLENSYFLGDSYKDVLAGEAAKCRTIFLHNEYNHAERPLCHPTYEIKSLSELLGLNILNTELSIKHAAL